MMCFFIIGMEGLLTLNELSLAAVALVLTSGDVKKKKLKLEV